MKAWRLVYVAALVVAFFVPAQAGELYCVTSDGCTPFKIGGTCWGQVVEVCPTITPSEYPKVIESSFSPLGMFFYAPCVIYEDGSWVMWTTVNDTVWRYVSLDGTHWTNGRQVLMAQPRTWEDDGGWITWWQSQGKEPDESFVTGISNPAVARLSDGRYIMAYTAGPLPNTETMGGVGLAYSEDGITWERNPQNPVLKAIGGSSFAQAIMEIDGLWFYYFAGGEYPDIPAPLRRVRLTEAGELDGTSEDLSRLPVYPLAWEPGVGSFVATMHTWNDAGPSGFDLFRGGDGVIDRGQKVASTDQALTGMRAQFHPGILERGPRGEFLPSLGGPTLIFGAGNAWGGWQPMMVGFGTRIVPVSLPPTSPIRRRVGERPPQLRMTFTRDWVATLIAVAYCPPDRRCSIAINGAVYSAPPDGTARVAFNNFTTNRATLTATDYQRFVLVRRDDEQGLESVILDIAGVCP